ncbi:lactonase family protein [Bosea sp. LjRoot237]|uniref:lactonase family protein n=1 Tax=Bosea sp. LjRoot237 TaxID=3342292 RepID=UPI003F507A6F
MLTPDGRHLFASNRGHDSLAGFEVDPSSGRLRPNGITPCGGRTPRFIALTPDASAVICANEESYGLTRLDVGEAGCLRPAVEIAQVRSPVCVVWKARST